MPDELKHVAPTQTSWQFTVEQALMKRRQFMLSALGHVRARFCGKESNRSVFFK